jgi:hypothetical protein
MPQMNRKGPEGKGPMTGRRMGRCTNYGASLKNQNTTPSDNQTGGQPENFPGRGLGFGRGRGGRGGIGRGMGWQNRFRGGPDR